MGDVEHTGWRMIFSRKLTDAEWSQISSELDPIYDETIQNWSQEECLALVQKVAPDVTLVEVLR